MIVTKTPEHCTLYRQEEPIAQMWTLATSLRSNYAGHNSWDPVHTNSKANSPRKYSSTRFAKKISALN